METSGGNAGIFLFCFKKRDKISVMVITNDSEIMNSL